MKKFIESIKDAISNAIARIALSLVYFFVILPTKIVMIIVRRDRLKLHFKSNSYWQEYKENNNYELPY